MQGQPVRNMGCCLLTQADLDLAVSNAYQQRVGAETEATRAKADRAAAELADAEQEVQLSPSHRIQIPVNAPSLGLNPTCHPV